jgi:hypothetical protein
VDVRTHRGIRLTPWWIPRVLGVRKGERTMPNGINVRWGWLKLMYAYTIVGAGGFGVGVLIAPKALGLALGWPAQDPVMRGIVASVYAAFGLVSVLGLRAPLKFAPVLLMQLFYKSIWLVGVVVPLLATRELPAHSLLFIAIFATYIVGDLIALPFSYLFASPPREPEDNAAAPSTPPR